MLLLKLQPYNFVIKYVLLCNCIEYYVIAMLHPWAQSISPIIYYHIVAYET